MSLLDLIDFFEVASNGENFDPVVARSNKYKHWISENDFKRCATCKDLHGKIWGIGEPAQPEPPLHLYCRCVIERMKTIEAGTATINKNDGADWTLMVWRELPEYYISLEEIEYLGWRFGKWPSNFAPGKMITRGIYDNRNKHLPGEAGRVWYEADINYTTGKRNSQRVVWSNDGLLFVTYDHYETFHEII